MGDGTVVGEVAVEVVQVLHLVPQVRLQEDAASCQFLGVDFGRGGGVEQG